MLGLSLVAASRGYSLVAVPGLLIAVASLVAKQGRVCSSSCGTSAELPPGMRDLPRSGIESVSTAYAGGFVTMSHQGSPLLLCCA